MENGIKKRVYLDYNATTPLAEEVLQTITSTLKEVWQNPSSQYSSGCTCKQVIAQARHEVANMIGALHTEIIFTSGGTESNNLVVYGALDPREKLYHDCNVLPHVISTNIEHDSIKLILIHLQNEEKIDVTFVPVSTSTGSVHPNDVLNSVRSNTCLISVMLANNETGILQPVAEIGGQLKRLNKKRLSENLPRIFLHTDAAQAFGKVEVDVQELGVDYLTIVGHKFYGPRIGALFVRDLFSKAVPLKPIFYGGGQEMSLRPGTENTAMIAGLGQAAKLVRKNLDIYHNHMKKMNAYLKEKLKEVFKENVVFNTSLQERVEVLPNTTSVAFPLSQFTGQEILQRAMFLEASTGAACHFGERPSAILLASGITEALAARTIRLSIGRETQKEEIDYAVECLQKALE